jgi:NADPH:quinone reductase-like Zn-dependent oxidoreductase
MKAIVWTKYGPPEGLQLQEVEKPVPKDNEVLIRIHATTVTAGDCEMRSLKLPLFLSLPTRMYVGPRRPVGVKIIGQEMAGDVEAVGKDVTAFKVGDPVFGATSFGQGTYCEYICLPEESDGMDVALAIKPANLSYEEAAAVPVGGLEALHFLRKANIRAGEKVLINGAGGSIGTIGIQLAKYYGAEVTAVDSAEKLDMLRSIGADHVIDYKEEDFTQGGLSYDVIFDVIGKSPFSRSMRSLKQNGRCLFANPKLSQMIRRPWISSRSDKKVIVGAAGRKAEDLIFLKELIEGGKIKVIIDRRYPLEEIAEAHHYVESGQKKGNVVLTLEPAITL